MNACAIHAVFARFTVQSLAFAQWGHKEVLDSLYKSLLEASSLSLYLEE